MSGQTAVSPYTPIGDGHALCLHPNETRTSRWIPPRRVRQRKQVGRRRWRLRSRWVAGFWQLEQTCPDCPQRAAFWSVDGQIRAARMPPWMIFIGPEER